MLRGVHRTIGCNLILAALLLASTTTTTTTPCDALVSPLVVVKGSAAKPYEKKKVAVWGAGGYLGACMFGFLQRAGSLYGNGIASIGSPRAITATNVGSMYLNGVLGKNFILAQADESFVKLTDMTSDESIRSRLQGVDAAILGTRYTLEKRPVTGGSYDKTPNDKTLEFYMDRPRSSTLTGKDDLEYCMDMFTKTLDACQKEGVKRLVVIETDGQFETASVGDKYLQLLESSGISFVYVQPVGLLDNFRDYTYAKGVQGKLSVQVINDVETLQVMPTPTAEQVLYREDLAALCVQSVFSLDWNTNCVLRVQSSGAAAPEESGKKTHQEWCVHSERLASLLSPIASEQ